MNSKLIIIYFVCCLFLNYCSSGNQEATGSLNHTDTSYEVYRIDSVNNYYVIYISRKDTNYKVISKKQFSENCRRIKNGKYYDFELTSLSIEINTPGFAECLWVDSITKICLENSIVDLKVSKNVKGLCYKGKK